MIWGVRVWQEAEISDVTCSLETLQMPLPLGRPLSCEEGRPKAAFSTLPSICGPSSGNRLISPRFALRSGGVTFHTPVTLTRLCLEKRLVKCSVSMKPSVQPVACIIQAVRHEVPWLAEFLGSHSYRPLEFPSNKNSLLTPQIPGGSPVAFLVCL